MSIVSKSATAAALVATIGAAAVPATASAATAATTTTQTHTYHVSVNPGVLAAGQNTVTANVKVDQPGQERPRLLEPLDDPAGGPPGRRQRLPDALQQPGLPLRAGDERQHERQHGELHLQAARRRRADHGHADVRGAVHAVGRQLRRSPAALARRPRRGRRPPPQRFTRKGTDLTLRFPSGSRAEIVSR